jgi:hypothetical protein
VAMLMDHTEIERYLQEQYAGALVRYPTLKTFEKFQMVYCLASTQLYASLKYHLWPDSNLMRLEKFKFISRALNEAAIKTALAWVKDNRLDWGLDCKVEFFKPFPDRSQ